MMADDLRSKLRDLGANEQQLNSKIVDMIENSWFDDEAMKSATVKEQIADIVKKGDKLQRKMDTIERRTTEYENNLRLANQSIAEHVITDKSTIDGILTYRKMLEATVDVFGAEKMTDEVICKAVESASYGMWRSIMGSKDNNYRSRY
jgi:hypothetical protein